MTTRRHFTQEYKDQAVSLVLGSGRTIAEVAKSIGVHEMTYNRERIQTGLGWLSPDQYEHTWHTSQAHPEPATAR